MASEAFTRSLSARLAHLIKQDGLKLEFVAASANVGVETVRRVRNGEVRKLWDRTAEKLAHFVDSECGTRLADELGGKEEAPDLLSMLVGENQEGVYLIQDGRIVFSNGTVQSMTGYTSEELSSQTYTRFLDRDSRRQEQDRRQRRLAGGTLSDRYEVAVIRKDGNRVLAETQIARLSVQGKKTALGTIRQLSS